MNGYGSSQPDGDRVQRDPDDDDERLAEDVLRRAEEACGSFCPPAECVLTEGAVLGHWRKFGRLLEAPPGLYGSS